MPKGETRIIVLPDVKIPSWNTFYSGEHWSQRSHLAQDIHRQIRAELDPEDEPFDGRVSIEIVGYFGGKALDPDNICSKPFIDGLKGWWIQDDTQFYVEKVSTRSENDYDNPRLEIIVTQTGEPFNFKCACCNRGWPNARLKRAHEKESGIDIRE